MRVSSVLSVSVLALLACSASQAYAGFEFVAPSQTAPAMATPPQRAQNNKDGVGMTIVAPAVPNDKISAEPLPLMSPPPVTSLPPVMPQIGKAPPPPMPLQPMQTAAEVTPLTPVVQDSDVLMISDEPMTPLRPMTSSAAAPMPSDAVQGFGKDVPLVLALQQIVPPNYRYSFEAGVMPGTRVNWTGGKPWKDVVADIARRNNMNVEIVSNVIALKPQKKMAPALLPEIKAEPQVVLPALPAVDPMAGTAKPVIAPSPWVADKEKPAAKISDMQIDDLPELVSSTPQTKTDDILIASADTKTASDAPMPLLQKAPAPKSTSAFDWKKPEAPKPAPVLPPMAEISQDAPQDIGAFDMPEDLLRSPDRMDKTPAAASVDMPPVQSDSDSVKEVVAAIAQDTPAPAPVTTPAFDPKFDANTKAKPSSVENKQIAVADEKPAAKIDVMPTPEDNKIIWQDKPPASVTKSVETKKIETKTEIAMVPSQPLVLPVKETMPASQPKAPVVPPVDHNDKDDLLPPTSLPPAPVASVASPAPATRSTLSVTREWQAQKGKTLRQTLASWSQDAGVSMVWSSEFDYPLQTDVRIAGAYPDAVRTVLAGFSKAKPRPLARLFRNQSVGAQPVLVVETERSSQ